MSKVFEARDFIARALHLDLHHARRLEASSFEAAAVAYLEDLHVDPAERSEIRVQVRDVATGQEHGFCLEVMPAAHALKRTNLSPPR
jgi:hypothetical protein